MIGSTVGSFLLGIVLLFFRGTPFGEMDFGVLGFILNLPIFIICGGLGGWLAAFVCNKLYTKIYKWAPLLIPSILLIFALYGALSRGEVTQFFIVHFILAITAMVMFYYKLQEYQEPI